MREAVFKDAYIASPTIVESKRRLQVDCMLAVRQTLIHYALGYGRSEEQVAHSFFAFLVGYVIVLIFIDTRIPAKWDKVTHLNSGLYLLRAISSVS